MPPQAAAAAADPAPSAANSNSPASAPAEVPSGMMDEAALLQAFADVPSISGVHVQELDGSSNNSGETKKKDLWVTVSDGRGGPLLASN